MSYSDEITKLSELHGKGILSDEEFVRAKARVIEGSTQAPPAAPPPSTGLHALHRSHDDRWIGGVCGGLAEVSGTPSWTWRILFTVLILLHGTGLLIYGLLWIFLPVEAHRLSCRR